jgi:hypothetical protein
MHRNGRETEIRKKGNGEVKGEERRMEEGKAGKG